MAAHERVKERAKEGQVMPRSMGVPRARARLPESPSEATPELLFLSRRGKAEAWKHRLEPPCLSRGSLHGTRNKEVVVNRNKAPAYQTLKPDTREGCPYISSGNGRRLYGGAARFAQR